MYRMIENPKDGDKVQYLGVYVLKWRPEWGKPDAAFVEAEDKDPKRYKKVVSALWKGLDNIVSQTGDANSIEHEMEWIRYKAIPDLLEKLAELEEGEK